MQTLLDHRTWYGLPDEERRAVARMIEDLFDDLAFDGIEQHRVFEIESADAFFVAENSRFVLVPGGTYQLGLNPDDCGFLNAWMDKVWNDEYVTRHGFPSLRDEMVANCSPSRSVCIRPFLIETSLRIPPNPRFKHDVYHDDAIRDLQGSRWRLPSPDEWEIAYRGRSTATFPWGDEPLARKEKPSVNAIGFQLPENWGYDNEFTCEPAVGVGGDGGATSHGGWGRLAELTIEACAYRCNIEQFGYLGAGYRRCRSIVAHGEQLK